MVVTQIGLGDSETEHTGDDPGEMGEDLQVANLGGECRGCRACRGCRDCRASCMYVYMYLVCLLVYMPSTEVFYPHCVVGFPTLVVLAHVIHSMACVVPRHIRVFGTRAGFLGTGLFLAFVCLCLFCLLFYLHKLK